VLLPSFPRRPEVAQVRSGAHCRANPLLAGRARPPPISALLRPSIQLAIVRRERSRFLPPRRFTMSHRSVVIRITAGVLLAFVAVGSDAAVAQGGGPGRQP